MYGFGFMRRFFGLRLVALSALVLGAPAVAGCGKASQDPVEVVRAAATKTTAEASSRLAFTVGLSGGPVAGTVRGGGVFDYAAKRGRITMDLGGITGSPVGGSIDSVVDGPTIYARFPDELASRLPGGKRWVKFDIEAAGKTMGLDLSQLTQAQQADPTQALDYLRGASDSVETVAADELRGVEATHYRVTLDLEKAGQALAPGQRAAFDKAIARLGTSSLPADVWIDGDGRLRKMSWSQDLSKLGLPAGTPGGRPSGTMRFEMELFDFGVEADVVLPPASETVDLPSMLGSLRGSLPAGGRPPG